MIPVIIFFGHTIFAVYAFAKSYQDEGLIQAFLNVAFIVILFAVGWAVTDFLTGFFIPAAGWEIPSPNGKILLGLVKMTGFYTPVDSDIARLAPKDSISLLLLTAGEYFFYKFLLRKTKVAQRI